MRIFLQDENVRSISVPSDFTVEKAMKIAEKKIHVSMENWGLFEIQNERGFYYLLVFKLTNN